MFFVHFILLTKDYKILNRIDLGTTPGCMLLLKNIIDSND